MSSFLTLFTLAAIATGSDINNLAQVHRNVYEPLRTNHSDYVSGYLDSEARQRSEGRKMWSKRNLSKEKEHVSLHADNLEDAGGDLVQRHVTLAIAVPSVRPDRRKAIRQTWSKWADDRVVLRFFTERPNQPIGDKSAEEATILLAEESLAYNDVIIQDIGMGMNFGLKLLWAMRWMSSHYSFDFFLRLDDDYFLCLERLLEDLDCLLLPGKQQSPIFAGYRFCIQNYRVAYVDEAYILFSSSIIDRVVATSNLNCSGYGSLTAASWIRVGGLGNPEGDVVFVHDYRLDHRGIWWKNQDQVKVDRSEYSSVCERDLAIHRTYPEGMNKLWLEVSGRTNVSRSTSDCKSLFRYEDDGKCPFVSRAVDNTYLERDNVQPCNSFSAKTQRFWCGSQGCRTQSSGKASRPGGV